MDVRTSRKAAGDSLFAQDVPQAESEPLHPLDGEDSRAEWRRLLAWLEQERELQSENRAEMAIDADMYDGFQWRPEDADQVRERGQMPLVFNEIAPMVDWMIGTERRTRVDSRVLPRTEDDVHMADVKTKVMKYMSDVNRAVYVRSEAFAEAVKAGLGWIDDGVRDDPTKEIIYKEHESWRNVLHDSRGAAQAKDLSRCRYIFRWRWVDLDVALAAFPERGAVLRLAAEDGYEPDGDEQDVAGWSGLNNGEVVRSGSVAPVPWAVDVGAARRRVKIYECQYRKPVQAQMVGDGPFRGAMLTDFDPVLGELAHAGKLSLVDKVMMRMHTALFTTAGLLAMGPSPFRHNDFTLTPVWGYRRGRDGMPYGMIRRVRDLQLDLNKRASKANFLINANQIVADDNATDDWDTLRDEASRPDGVMAVRPGARFEIRRDTDQVAGQVQMMQLSASAIQKSGGVADENLGRQTNAISGEAIKARQMQGSVVTTEPFDNLRLATHISGAKELSLIEQFITEEKVVRLTGEQGRLDWIKVNRIDVQADGSVRVLDDLTASKADYVVADQDYAGTLRQVMFDSLNQIAQRLPPEMALRLMRMAFDFSDLPNKDAIVQEFRAMTGEADPDRELTPQEQQAQAEQQQAAQQAVEMQRQDALLALEERRAKVREINAKAAQIEAGLQAGADAQTAQAGAGDDVLALVQTKAQAQDEMDRLGQEIARVTAELTAARTRADNAVEVARIKADAEIRKAEILAASDERLAALQARLQALEERARIPEQPHQPEEKETP